MIRDIRVVCSGTAKSGPHVETDMALVGWDDTAKNPNVEFIAYGGPTPYSAYRPRLWPVDRDFTAYGMIFRFNTCRRCKRDQPLSFEELRRYAEALKAEGNYDAQGRLTLNLSALPGTIGISNKE